MIIKTNTVQKIEIDDKLLPDGKSLQIQLGSSAFIDSAYAVSIEKDHAIKIIEQLIKVFELPLQMNIKTPVTKIESSEIGDYP